VRIARVNRKKGNYDAALQAYERLLPLANQANNQSLAATTHAEMGRLLVYQDQFPRAIDQFDEANRLYQLLGLKPKIAYILTSRSDVLWQIGDFQEARASRNQATEMANQEDKNLLAIIPLYEARQALGELAFQIAIVNSKKALQMSEGQYPDLAHEAKCILVLAQAMSGAIHSVGRPCEDAVNFAQKAGDKRLLAEMSLALAQVEVGNGQWQDALTTAQQAQEQFASSGKVESEWRAWLVVASASRHTGNEPRSKHSAAQAKEVLSRLQQKWGAEVYRRYLSRPDVQQLYTQL